LDVKKRFTEEQIIGFLREADAGMPVKELCRKHGFSERRSLAVVGMSASAYRYQAQPDRNVTLRQRIVALAQRHKRYGVGMIHLKLRQEGAMVNYKRVERLYQEERLQVRRRRRKKVPVAERQPLFRPTAPNEVWSMDRPSSASSIGGQKRLAFIYPAYLWARLPRPGRHVEAARIQPD
jgi:transposase InsO family protein